MTIFDDYVMTTFQLKHLHKERNEFDHRHVKLSNKPVLSAGNKFQNHPSIVKIKSNRIYSKSLQN